MKSKILITLSLLAACSLGLAPISSFAAEKEKKGAAAASTDTTKPIPYTGKVTKVDEAAKAFTLSGKSGRVLHVTDTTKIEKDGAEATFSSIAVNDEVRGQATKTADKWTAVSVNVGPKEKATEKKKGGTTEATDKPAPAKEGTTPVKGAKAPAPATTGSAAPTSGAGSANSSSAGPAVNGVPQPGGEAPAGAKKN